jgi:hypothetical protein
MFSVSVPDFDYVFSVCITPNCRHFQVYDITTTQVINTEAKKKVLNTKGKVMLDKLISIINSSEKRPSLRQMADAVGLNSAQSVKHYLNKLK